MKNCIKVAKNNFKRSFNRRTNFVVNLVIPILVVILGILANSVSKPSFTIGVIHENMSADIVELLSNTKGITVTEANADTIKIDLITGKYASVIDFSTSDYELFSIKDKRTNDTLEQIIDRYKTTSAPVSMEKIVGTGMSVAERTIAFIVMFLMVTATVTASLMIKDKNSGTLQRYKYSPQKPIHYILGNYIYTYLITFLQFLISITFMQVIRVNIGISYSNLILLGIWLSGTATAFGIFMSSIYQKEMYANLSASFIALLLSLIGGTFIAYENMPNMLQNISIISPQRWFLAITKNMEHGISWFENVKLISILSGMIISFILVSSYINKKTKVI